MQFDLGNLTYKIISTFEYIKFKYKNKAVDNRKINIKIVDT